MRYRKYATREEAYQVILKNARQWQINNPERYKARMKKYYKDNRKTILKKQKTWNATAEGKAARAAQRRRSAEQRRDYALRYEYGITLVEFNEMLEAQRHRCKVCKIKLAEKPHTDHDHKTKFVRGILCQKCNHGLGLFKDSSKILRDAAAYLDNAMLPLV